MHLPTTKPAGAPLRARDVRALAQVGQAVLNSRGGLGVNLSSGPSGLSLALEPEDRLGSDRMRAWHTDESVAPVYGVTQIYDALETGSGQLTVACRRPPYGGISRIGIYMEGADQNSTPELQVKGATPVRYDAASVPDGKALAFGMRLGAHKDSYLAVWDDLGPMRVVGLLQDVEDGVGLALVEMTGLRGDCVYIRTKSGSVYGPFYSLLVGAGLTVDSPSKGKVRIGRS